ncbi:hypothetical protein Tco_0800957 [Tanacetum coccineum]|uniref:Uncharacterized protein n=1 Tax=Tanacetum coccineum TaxID=301880 RepID=A0ABQ4ZUL9_9ASTR
MASNKSFVSSPMVDDCDIYTSDETVQSKVTVTEVLAVKDDAFMVDCVQNRAISIVMLFVDHCSGVGSIHSCCGQAGPPYGLLHSSNEGLGADNLEVIWIDVYLKGVVIPVVCLLIEPNKSGAEVYIKDDDGNVVVSDKKRFNGDEDLSESKRSDTGDVDMVHVSVEDMLFLMIAFVSVKETIIISDDDEVLVFGSSEKKSVSDYTFSSDDDDVQIVCVKNSNGKCCHDDPFSGGMPRMKRSKNHHRGPIALQFVLDEASKDEEE